MKKELNLKETASQFKFWLILAITIGGGGFGAAMYLNRYAQAAVVDGINERMTQHEARLSIVEVQAKNIEEDYHQVANQLLEIARTVGAREIPPPPHREDK